MITCPACAAKQQASTRKRRILNKAVNICRLPANNTECLAKNRIRAKIVAERADQLNFGGHIMRWQNLVVFLFCLLLTGCGLKVATDSSPGDVEATVQDFKTDSNRLVPEFYRSRYQTETSVSFQHNQMFKSVYFLSLFLFPICAIAFVSHKNFGGDLDFKIIVVFLSFAINFLVPLLSFLVAWFIYFLLGVFSSDGLFVPVDFVCLVLLFVGHGVDAFLLTVYLRRESNVRDLTRVPENSPAVSALRTRSGLKAMLRATMTAGLTAAAGQLGGWIGALIVFVLASGIAAAFGVQIQAHERHSSP